MPCNAENLHALLHDQYFSKHRFLDICRYAFNSNNKLLRHLKTFVMQVWQKKISTLK